MIDLDAIGVRCRDATAGPWLVDSDQRLGGAAQVVEAADTTCAVCFMTSDRFECRDDADAQFIAHARTDVEQMEQALREAVSVIRELRRGDCWCEVGIGNPNAGGMHTRRCEQARDWLARWFGK